MVRPLALGTFLVAYGNLASLIGSTAAPAADRSAIGLGLLLLGLMLLWARLIEQLSPAELGVTRSRFVRSAGLGLLLAIATAVPALAFLRFPPLVGKAVEYSPLGPLAREALLWWAFVWMPLDTAIPEEVAFRGVLLATLRRHLADRQAVLVSALVFTLWHVVIVSRTIALTNLHAEPLFATLGLIGALVAVGVGGVLFAWLRLATRHLAGSIVAHWAFNALLVVGLVMLAS